MNFTALSRRLKNSRMSWSGSPLRDEARLHLLLEPLPARLGQRPDLPGHGRQQLTQIDALPARRDGAPVEARQEQQVLATAA